MTEQEEFACEIYCERLTFYQQLRNEFADMVPLNYLQAAALDTLIKAKVDEASSYRRLLSLDLNADKAIRFGIKRGLFTE